MRGRPAAIQIVVGLALVLAAETGAHAGTAAALNVLGFSADGRYFAFEQFGVSDGSGSGFAQVVVIDVANDRYVPGSPVKAGTESSTLDQARAEAAAKIAAVIASTGISAKGLQVGAVAAARAREQTSGLHVDPLRTAASSIMPLDDALFGRGARLVLGEVHIAQAKCEYGPEIAPIGFMLVLERDGRPPVLMTVDDSVPRSRTCPTRYGLAEAHAMRVADGSVALAVIVQYFHMGFEGPDRSFLAVTANVR